MSYTVRDGDTFGLISRKVYGVETDASLIRDANPGVVEPLRAGMVLAIPAKVDRSRAGTLSAGDDNEVAVRIGGVAFARWENISITRSLDSMDTYTLRAPFEPDDDTFRAIFKPLKFLPIVISVGGAPLFTGTQVKVTPEMGDRRVVATSGYSLPGVLEDCTMPASAFPLEFNKVDLQAIALQVCSPFGVVPVFESAAGAVFEQVEIKPSDKVLPFLVKLAQQRGLLVGSSSVGALVFRKVSESFPVATLVEGETPLLSADPTFNEQEYYSDVTGVEPIGFAGLPSQQVTVKNSSLSGVVRPFTYTVPDAEGGEVQTSVENKIARMFGSAIAYTVEVDTWRGPRGALWTPGDTLTLVAPGVMIYTETAFIIRRVTFKRKDTATLELVLPGAYDNSIPRRLPWD